MKVLTFIAALLVVALANSEFKRFKVRNLVD